MDQGDEQSIRERAYYLWQKEGSPDGRDREFWERAALIEGAADTPNLPTPLQSAESHEVDVAMEDTFPASDPPAFTAPTRVGENPEAPLKRS